MSPFLLSYRQCNSNTKVALQFKCQGQLNRQRNLITFRVHYSTCAQVQKDTAAKTTVSFNVIYAVSYTVIMAMWEGTPFICWTDI